MNILRRNSKYDLLSLALSEKNRARRYAMLNDVAASFKSAQSIEERGFAAVCYELNGEKQAAIDSSVKQTALESGQDSLFSNSCILLQQKNIGDAKETFRKAVKFLKHEQNYDDLGILIRLHRMLLEQFMLPVNDYFQGIDLPVIAVIKNHTSTLSWNIAEGQLQLGLQKADDLKGKVAFAISCCSNKMEQQMLDCLIKDGARAICAPQLEAGKLHPKMPEDEWEKLASLYKNCEFWGDFLQETASLDEELWKTTEDYSAKYLLGLALLKRDETGLPIVYVCSGLSNRSSLEELEGLCKLNGVSFAVIGGENA